jgi:hypothetical protein
MVTFLSVITVQALVDALPSGSMPQLKALCLSETNLFLTSHQRLEIDKLALESLARLPQLTELKISDRLSVQQLSLISSIGTLRRRMVLGGFWDSIPLSALCHPTNHLQQLEEFDVHKTSLEAEDMQQLVRLPALTKSCPMGSSPTPTPICPASRASTIWSSRSVTTTHRNSARSSERRWTPRCASAEPTMVSVIDRSVGGAALPDKTGARLVRALPHLCCLVLISICVPSLRFLKHAPQLEELEFKFCEQISSVHLALLGQAAPRLNRLEPDDCN